MWFARHIIIKRGIPKELAWRITSYFEWSIQINNYAWPNHPCSSKAEKYFLEQLPPNTCLRPKAEKPFGVPRHILVSFQDQRINEKYGFYQGNERKDAYLTIPKYVPWGHGFETTENAGSSVPDSQRNQEPLNDVQFGWDVVHSHPYNPYREVEELDTEEDMEE